MEVALSCLERLSSSRGLTLHTPYIDRLRGPQKLSGSNAEAFLTTANRTHIPWFLIPCPSRYSD